MKIVPLGTEALLVDFGQTISPEVNRQAIALAQRLEESPLPGFLYCAPAYASLTVGFDPRRVSFAELCKHLLVLHDDTAKTNTDRDARVFRIPVCYHAAFAPDLEVVMEHTGLDQEAIIETHCSKIYRVYMLGFLPGFTYLGDVADTLITRRKARPRTRVPAGSVGLAGRQTGIYPVDAPGGWQIIGRTPVRTFDPGATPPFLALPGDQVRFEPVSHNMFTTIEQEVAEGTYQLRQDGA
ncbi:MAG: 5-oxoprolinase subunit PxpB [Saprospiraceae bacterium]|nr:5-oxoprolinase subunit PxpB [Saprospiraceae bacterium]